MRAGFLVLWLAVATGAAAQGKIMLVGGGSEESGTNGWSNAPYTWAVNQSLNKKVAVISYDNADNWIPDYFKALGAAEADNIKIDSKTVADLQATYDNLMQYDVFFFKGGDQSEYYNYFKGTKTQQAIEDKFVAGGVITGTSAGLAILSKVIFAAQGGSVYPDDALQNFNYANITLANDFLPFLEGYIVDSHFTERGRGPRLLAFIANWYETHGEKLTGIGVDDRTALCIDANKLATVYGTGTVSFYSAGDFANQGNKMVNDSIHVTQLVHGNTINLETGEMTNVPTTVVTPVKNSETGNYEVLLSGSASLSTNTNLLTFFINNTGNPTDSVIVVTAPGKGTSFIQRLRTNIGLVVTVVETSANYNHADSLFIRNTIRKSKKVLFVENNDDALFSFLQGGPTGSLINSHIRRNKIVTVFIGEDSRYAGKKFVTNHKSDVYAAYYGRLAYRDGLALLPTSTIMSNTYDASSTDYYENTTAAVPYSIVNDKLKYGVYLNRNSYLHFFQNDGVNYWRSTGTFPTLIILNSGTPATFVSQPVNSGGASRNYAGFLAMRMVLLHGVATLKAGVAQPTTDPPYVFESPVLSAGEGLNQISLKVFPNPSESGIFHLSSLDAQRGNRTVVVSDNLGRQIQTAIYTGQTEPVIDLSAQKAGVYFITVISNQQRHTLKVIR